MYQKQIISRPGQSQGLLYKKPRDSFSQPFPPTALLCRHSQTVSDSTSSYNIDYVIMIKKFLNPKGHQNIFSGSKATAILLEGWNWPVCGVASGRVCVCSLRSRLVIIFFNVRKIYSYSIIRYKLTSRG